MKDDAGQVTKDLTARLWVLPIRDYLASKEFFRFCQQHDLWDAWREYLRLSEDMPDLYGDTVIKNAFSRFLFHILHSRPEEFLQLFTALLADFSHGISCYLPVDDIKTGLLPLGYPEPELDHALFILRIRQNIEPGPDAGCCPEKKDNLER